MAEEKENSILLLFAREIRSMYPKITWQTKERGSEPQLRKHIGGCAI